MKPLLILLISFALLALGARVFSGQWMPALAGNLAMCLMLLVTGISHFIYSKGMQMMMPVFIPYKPAIVYVTGLMEIALGLALAFPASRLFASQLLVFFFAALLIANIRAAMNRINYEKADYSGPGPAYLWFRVPLQCLFIAWVVYFGHMN